MLNVKFISKDLILAIVTMIPIFNMLYGIVNAKKMMLIFNREDKDKHKEKYKEYIEKVLYLISTISFFIIKSTVLKLLIVIAYFLMGFIYFIVYFKISNEKKTKVLFIVLAIICLGISLYGIAQIFYFRVNI
ncbi:hypothetical protein [Caloranaerobacter azorensis]|uniref:Uncharacterized protein n=1 Tax=Caloranaerobacter azorensis TaxID=116090 RepID=A0A6P1YDR3_9FIRM|nr:hypothetical protein [Caloranaerobacter azorensis]QIB27217.1 hypothetical protein G3A45_07925 [Caloranaerobacter azorensis]